MPRKTFIHSDIYPYHIFNRVQDKNFYQLPMDRLWKIYCDQLRILTWIYGIKIHAFLLMGNHYHLCASSAEGQIPNAIGYMQSQISRFLTNSSNTQRYRFTGRFRWKIIRSHRQYLDTVKYIYRNPAGNDSQVACEIYPWSTLHGQMGLSPLEIPISPSIYPNIYEVSETDEFLFWLNNGGPRYGACAKRYAAP